MRKENPKVDFTTKYGRRRRRVVWFKPPYTIHRLRVVLRDILNEFEHIHGKKEKKICFSTSFSRLSYDGTQAAAARRGVAADGAAAATRATATTTI